MKYHRILPAAIAAAIALSGCSGDTEQPDMPAKADDNTLSPEVYETPSADEYGGGEQDFSESATRLSVTDGSLEINRRTPSGSSYGAEEDSWTILVYLCGTDLESDNGAASSDIIEAVNAQYSENVHIVYQTGGTNEWGFGFSTSSIQRYENINYDIMLVDEVPDASMGSAETLADFISWGIEKYPAEKMGLILWNHGGGSISGVCFDEKNEGDSLSLREIDSALNSVYEQMSDKFEFIGFDACLMSTLETANILVPYARYMFASEEIEPGVGWNYTELLNYLAENPDANGADLGEIQCESYYQHCIDGGDYEGATFAITDLSKLDELLISFDETAKEMYESEDIADISRAVQKADNFGGNNRSEGYTNMVDLKGLLNAAMPYAPNAEDTLEKLESAVICSISGPQHEGTGGLSLYYPLSVQGSTELSTFADICTSSYYLALAARETVRLNEGDVITPLYLAIADGDSAYIEGGEYLVSGEPEIEYYPLFDGNYSYSMTLYDIFGNYSYMPSITFQIDENGDIYIDRSEL